MSTVLGVLAGVMIAGTGMFLAQRSPAFGVWWFGLQAIADVILAALDAARRDWGSVAVLSVCAVLNAIWWDQCRRRRKRKRAAALAGAKSRARIAKLVRRACSHVPFRSPSRAAHGDHRAS